MLAPKVSQNIECHELTLISQNSKKTNHISSTIKMVEHIWGSTRSTLDPSTTRLLTLYIIQKQTRFFKCNILYAMHVSTIILLLIPAVKSTLITKVLFRSNMRKSSQSLNFQIYVVSGREFTYYFDNNERL